MSVEVAVPGVEEDSYLNQDVQQSAYTYERANGTVEHASSAEEAIRLCPELAKIALNSPELANMMLEVAAEGSAKLQIESKAPEPKAIEDKPETKVSDSIDSTEQVNQKPIIPTELEMEVIESPVFVVDEQETVSEITQDVIVAAMADKPIDKHLVDADSVLDTIQLPDVVAYDNFLRHSEEVQKVVQQEDLKYPIIETIDLAETRQVQKPQVTVETPKPENISEKPEPQTTIEVSAEEQSEPVKLSTEEVTIENFQDEVVELPVPLVETVSEEVDIFEKVIEQNQTENVYSELPEFPIPQKTPEQFEPQVVETYAGLLAAEREHTLAHEEAPAKETTTFEEVLNAESEAEVPDSIAEVIEHAKENTLENSLVDLVRFFDTKEQTSSEDAVAETVPEIIETPLLEAVRDVQEYVKALMAVQPEVAEPKIELTLELTEKLVILVSELGYDEPEKVLVQLVEERGLEFLIEVCDKISDYDTIEIHTKAAGVTLHVMTERLHRLAKQIFGLILTENPQPGM